MMAQQATHNTMLRWSQARLGNDPANAISFAPFGDADGAIKYARDKLIEVIKYSHRLPLGCVRRSGRAPVNVQEAGRRTLPWFIVLRLRDSLMQAGKAFCAVEELRDAPYDIDPNSVTRAPFKSNATHWYVQRALTALSAGDEATAHVQVMRAYRYLANAEIVKAAMNLVKDRIAANGEGSSSEWSLQTRYARDRIRNQTNPAHWW